MASLFGRSGGRDKAADVSTDRLEPPSSSSSGTVADLSRPSSGSGSLASSLPPIPGPAVPLISEDAFELLYAELLPVITRSTLRHTRATQLTLTERIASVSLDNGESTANVLPVPTHAEILASPPDEAELEAISARVEQIGYSVGLRLVERLCLQSTIAATSTGAQGGKQPHSATTPATVPRFTEALDAVKFVCKEIWLHLYRKKMDSLKTNHRGIFILQDARFKWFARMAGDEGAAASTRSSMAHMWLPCGIVRGVLTNLGFPCVVVPESPGLPQLTMHVKMVGTRQPPQQPSQLSQQQQQQGSTSTDGAGSSGPMSPQM
ncbi:hypothetical protein GQ42DRAFT_165730 [Ramicandelaber brevisporus]|nr:hypothetical protein GQ42DRAFT_165730 [Ramicandelaber brevisporus]